MLGMRESHEDWLALGRDLIARGLGAPMLIVADGAPGLIKAVEQCWPRLGPPALRRSPRAQPARQAARARTRTRPPGLLAGARRGHQPSATASDDSRPWSASSTRPATPRPPAASPTTSTRSSCTCATRSRTAGGGASTNLLERSLGEVKRRTKVIGRFPGETSCLTLVWAVLDLYISHASNGVKFTELERQRLNRIRYQPTPTQTTDEEVTAA